MGSSRYERKRIMNKRTLFLLITFIVFVFCLTEVIKTLQKLNPNFELKYLICTVTPVLLISFYLNKKKLIIFTDFIYILGLPSGLLFSIINIVNSLNEITDTQEFKYYLPSFFLPIIYGGILTTLGYLIEIKNDQFTNKMNVIDFLFCIIIFIIFLFIPKNNILYFFDLPSLCISLVILIICVVPAIKFGKDLVKPLTNSSLIICFAGAAIGILAWFTSTSSNDKDDLIGLAIAIPIMTIYYGTLLYLLSILIAFKLNSFKEIDYPVKNWHILESYIFYIFIVMAPTTFLEYLINKQ